MLLALSTAQKFSTGGITFLIGIVTTFLMLTILVCVVNLMSYLRKTDSKKLLHKREQPQSTDGADAVIEHEQAIPEQTLDAINAAVEVFMTKGDTSAHKRYTIRSIKKINKGDA